MAKRLQQLAMRGLTGSLTAKGWSGQTPQQARLQPMSQLLVRFGPSNVLYSFRGAQQIIPTCHLSNIASQVIMGQSPAGL